MKKLRITIGDKSYEVTVEVLSDDSPRRTTTSGPSHSAQPLEAVARSVPAGPAQPAGEGAVTSPMAGVVKSVLVSEGDVVEQGQALVVLEAMKMDNKVTAPSNATVKSIEVAEGDSVQEGHVLIVLG